MRARAIVASVAVAGLALAAPLQAAPKPRQRIDGSIRVAVPHPVYSEGCLGFGVQYQVAWLEQPALSGHVGYQFTVDPRTWNREFELVPSDPRSDLDIAFFPDFQPVYVDDPYWAYDRRGYGGEEGLVPPGMTKALVCMHSGNDVSFRYTAGA
jgi:hypothetical protein